MNESLLGPTELPPVAPPATAPATPGLAGWVREGLRAAFLLRPRVQDREPHPRVLLLIAAFSLLLDLVVGRLEVDGPAELDLGAWLAPTWGLAACALLVWALLWRPADGRAPRSGGVASWFALWLVASIPPGLVSEAIDILQARSALPDALADSDLFAWVSHVGLFAWIFAIVLRLGWHFGLRRGRLALLAAGFLLVFFVNAWQFPDRPWQSPDDDDEDEDAPQMQMDPQRFEARQDALDRALAALNQARA